MSCRASRARLRACAVRDMHARRCVVPWLASRPSGDPKNTINPHRITLELPPRIAKAPWGRVSAAFQKPVLKSRLAKDFHHGAATGGTHGQNTTASLEKATAAGVAMGGGTRDAARQAERVMTSELDARQGSSASPGMQIGAGGGRRTVAGSRQRERWIARLDEMGVLPKGEERAAALRSLGAQRQRADAYAAASARAAPRAEGRRASDASDSRYVSSRGPRACGGGDGVAR